MARKKKSRRNKQKQTMPQTAPSAPAPKPSGPASDSADMKLIETPPTTIGGILMRLGPGLIVAGSIVGSGELIATTATGAQAGFTLLWLILIGCVIKVFVQVELGRFSLVTGQTTMTGLNSVPGPVISLSLSGDPKKKPLRGNWIVWYWFLMFMASIAQLGGIVGAVGQALAISAPITEGGRNYNAYAEAETQLIVVQSEWGLWRDATTNRDYDGEQDPAKEMIRALATTYDYERRANAAFKPLKKAERDAADDAEKRAQFVAELAAIESAAKFLVKEPTEDMQRLVAYASLYIFYDAKLETARQSFEKDEKDEFAAKSAAELRDRCDYLRGLIDGLEVKTNSSVLAELTAARKSSRPPDPIDDKLWATLVTAITVVVLVMGRYGLIQSFSTAMVGLFTLITVVNLFMLQTHPTWQVDFSDIIDGMRFRLPEGNTWSSLATALATFGIIGVGASELVTYPYWCIEKGYARFTGPRNSSPEWAERARGWMRVMRWDAWCSMVVYTFATVAFYLLGAAILGRTSLDPKGPEMIRYLSVMYEPVFGGIAQGMFLFGSFAVLYSTFFVANASLARVFSDVLRVLNLARDGDEGHRARVRILSGILPITCCSFYWMGFEPQGLVLFSGFMQATMLPMVAGAALYFRYYRCDKRIEPGRVWDVLLWISMAGMLLAGGYAAWMKIGKLIAP